MLISAEPTQESPSVIVLCPECGERIVIRDIGAFVLGLHQRVCGELAAVNGEPE